MFGYTIIKTSELEQLRSLQKRVARQDAGRLKAVLASAEARRAKARTTA